MAEGELLMVTQADRDRLVALKKAVAQAITQRQAAEELDISERQVRRLLNKLKDGDRQLQHALRGRPSKRKIDEAVEKQAVGILSQDVYRGFGPKLACDYLSKKHAIQASKETVRHWMVKAGLWEAGRQRIGEVHVWRRRRERCGELAQWDTSEHDWLEGRGGKLYLIKMIDDATSRVFAPLVRHDSTEENMAVLEEYLGRFGRPWNFTRTKRASSKPRRRRIIPCAKEPLPPTQIGRALAELGIGWIAAHSPQAKGRVERSFQTAQDRLVKGLRVAGARTLEEANAYLDAEYLPDWEEKFTVMAACPDNAYRPLGKTHNLEAILCVVEDRVVSNDYTIRYGGRMYQIARKNIRPGLRGTRVRVEQRRGGEIAVRFEGKYLGVSECQPVPKGPPVRKAAERARPGSNAGARANGCRALGTNPRPR